MGTPEYFTDQYGHIYRWQATDTGAQSVSVANFQQHGSRAESNRLIDKANTATDLLAALEAFNAWRCDYGSSSPELDAVVCQSLNAIKQARGA